MITVLFIIGRILYNKKYILAIGVRSGSYIWVKRASEMGYTIIAINREKLNKCRASEYIEREYIIDFEEKKKIIKICQLFNISFVLPYAVDGEDVTMIGFLNSFFGFKSLKYKPAYICSHKRDFYKHCLNNGDARPKWQIILNDLPDFSQLTYPCIVKPDCGSGQQGIKKIESFRELQKYILENKEELKNGRILLEEFVIGSWQTVSGMVINHKIFFMTQSHAGNFYKNSQTPSETITYSPKLSDSNIVKIQNLIDHIGLNNTSFVMDLIVDSDGGIISFCELDSRPAALAPFAYDKVNSTDSIGCIIKIASGKDMTNYSKNLSENIFSLCIKLLETKAGEIKEISIPDKIKEVVFFETSLKAGAKTINTTNVVEGVACGMLIASGVNEEIALLNARNYCKDIIIKYK